jgi:hypothetical protein
LKEAINETTNIVFLNHLSGECNNISLVSQGISRLQRQLDPKFQWVICLRTESSAVAVYRQTQVQLHGGITNHTYAPLPPTSLEDFFA